MNHSVDFADLGADLPDPLPRTPRSHAIDMAGFSSEAVQIDEVRERLVRKFSHVPKDQSLQRWPKLMHDSSTAACVTSYLCSSSAAPGLHLPRPMPSPKHQRHDWRLGRHVKPARPVSR